MDAQVIAAPADLLVTKEATNTKGNGVVSNKKRHHGETTTTTTTAETKKGGIINWLKSHVV